MALHRTCTRYLSGHDAWLQMAYPFLEGNSATRKHPSVNNYNAFEGVSPRQLTEASPCCALHLNYGKALTSPCPVSLTSSALHWSTRTHSLCDQTRVGCTEYGHLLRMLTTLLCLPMESPPNTAGWSTRSIVRSAANISPKLRPTLTRNSILSLSLFLCVWTAGTPVSSASDHLDFPRSLLATGLEE